MDEKPELSIELSEATFRSFYYLKEELVDFCRKNGIDTSGSKIEIADRIPLFLITGIKEKPVKLKPSKKHRDKEIQLETLIEEGIQCSEIHRTFFKEKLVESFSFNVRFQKWLKENSGKTYEDACKAYLRIKEESKTVKTTIGKQFEYNTYIRDFFNENKNQSFKNAILCWKYKKSLPGHNKYESTDLVALD